MAKIKLSQSSRKFIRTEKARIRRSVSTLEEQKKLISGLYPKVEKSPSL